MAKRSTAARRVQFHRATCKHLNFRLVHRKLLTETSRFKKRVLLGKHAVLPAKIIKKP